MWDNSFVAEYYIYVKIYYLGAAMKKQLVIFISNVIILFGCVGITVNFMPVISPYLSFACIKLAKLSSPDYIYNEVKLNISNNIQKPSVNNTTAPYEEKPVMNVTGSEDSKDGYSLTETPADVKKLMKQAEKAKNKPKAKGKTSEEAYQGGGKIISFGGVEIQSKIPEKVYSPDIRSLLERDSDLIIRDKSKPSVLIYHSHTTEAYSLLDTGYYISSDARSKDSSRNVVRVGDELVKALEQAGFSVIHDKKIHDENYTASYDNSRETVEEYLEKYPSIEVTIDLHRDDITYSNKTKVKPTANIKGKKAARMMIIAGCEYGLVKNFPDWEYNLRFDLQVQKRVNEMYKGVMRPILFSQRKYNMYETHNSFLLEIGTDANTLEEACYSARLFGNALGKLMNEKYVKK